MFRNQKGSIPIVMIIALTSVFTVLILGNLLVAENIANKKQNVRLEQQTYSTRNTVETTINIILQKIYDSRTEYKQATIYPLIDADIQEAADTLNSSILPHISPNYSVEMSNLKYDTSLDTLCDATTSFMEHTDSTSSTGVTCKSTYFSLSFHLKIISDKNTRNIQVTLDNLYPEEDKDTGYIKVNADNVHITYGGF
ncbi:hypothetical protein U8V72_19830 [Priestia filamentosa]|uniref:hypothetical protein n=1 Tax=Priestia filamentosa TaxID=1402861 RepID=UPI0005893B31